MIRFTDVATQVDLFQNHQRPTNLLAQRFESPPDETGDGGFVLDHKQSPAGTRSEAAGCDHIEFHAEKTRRRRALVEGRGVSETWKPERENQIGRRGGRATDTRRTRMLPVFPAGGGRAATAR
jgi:hypothetical protein